jgi:hypothetical protein
MLQGATFPLVVSNARRSSHDARETQSRLGIAIRIVPKRIIANQFSSKYGQIVA